MPLNSAIGKHALGRAALGASFPDNPSITDTATGGDTLTTAVPVTDSATGTQSVAFGAPITFAPTDSATGATATPVAPATMSVPTYDDVVMADGPTAYWKLNDLSGTTAKDSSGNGYDATINGGVTLKATKVVPSTTDNAMSFNGSTGYVLAPNTLPALGTKYTIVLWYAIDSSSNAGFNGLWGTDQPSGTPFDGAEGGIHNNDGTNLWFDQGNGTANNDITTNAFPVTLGVGMCYAARLNAGTMDLFVNGQHAGTANVSGTAANGRFQFSIGAREAGGFGFFFGRLARVAIFQGTALSDTRLQEYYNAGIAATDQGVASDVQGFGAPQDIEVADSAAGTQAFSLPTITPSIPDAANAGEPGTWLPEQIAITLPPIPDSAAGQAEILYMGVVKAPQADSGTGTDTPSLATLTLAISNPGTGSDVPTLAVVSVSISDAASGTDSQATRVPVSVSDTGSGSESQPILATMSPPDVAAGSDAVSLATISVPISTTGAGTDTVAVTISVTPSDVATGADGASIQVPLTLNVAVGGVGQEQLSIPVTLTVSDAASGLDVQTTKGIIPLVETGTGADAVSLTTVSVNLREVGAGLDNPGLLISFFVPDSGNGADVPVLGPVPVLLVDNASGTDSASMTLALVPRSDTGTGSEAISEPTLAVGVSDTGTGRDTPNIPSPVSAQADAGAGADAVAVTVAIPLSDAAVAAENLVLSVAAPRVDTALGQDIPSNLVMIAISDAASGAELQRFTVTLPLGDSGSGTDTPSIVLPLALSDAAGGAEAISNAVTLSLRDNATGDGVTVYGPLVVHQSAVSDTGYGGELLTSSPVAVAIADAGAGSELTAMLVRPGLSVDAASGTDAPSIASTLVVLDSATGSEVISFTLIPVAVPSDAAAGAETLLVGNMTFITVPTDTSTGAEVVVLAPTSKAALVYMSGPGGKSRAVFRGPGMQPYVISVSSL